MLYNFGNRRESEFPLSLFTMPDIDLLIKKNFRRILDRHRLQQNTLALSIGKSPSEINDILAGRKPMGKDTMTRICVELKIDPWEFYWTEKTPIIKDQAEQAQLSLYRQAEQLGIADQVREQEEIWIERAKKKEGAGSEGKTSGVPRRSHKRAG